MSKKLIAISIAVLVIGLFSTVAMAGVEGYFDFDISLEPQVTTAEAVPFDIDFEGYLILDVTLSGLTFSNDLVFGVAGIEHYVTNLDTTLGALALTDEFWFAAPYDADNVKLGDLQFVKKRVEAEITLAGLTLTNNIVWEDVMFGHPYTTLYVSEQTPSVMPDSVYRFGMGINLSGETVSGIGVVAITGLSYDPQLTNAVKKYSASGAYDGKDLTVGPEGWEPSSHTIAGGLAKDATHTSTFTFTRDTAFGPVIPSSVDISMTCTQGGTELVEGTDYELAVDGIDSVSSPVTVTVTGTALKDLSGSDIVCTDYIITYESAPQFPEFSVEKINITDISVAGVTIDNSLEFRPSEPVSNTIDASFSLLDFLDVALSYTFSNILTLTPGAATYTLSTDFVSAVITDNDADLALTSGDTVDLTAELPIQFLTLDVSLSSTVGTGMDDLGLVATLDLGTATFSADAEWLGTPLTFDDITYTISTTVDSLRFEAFGTFNATALEEAGISVGVDFAV